MTGSAGARGTDWRAAAASARRPMLVFDGDCGFCTNCAEFLRKRLADDVTVAPFQWIDDLAAWGLTLDEVTEGIAWVHRDGRVTHSALAGADTLEAMGKGWRFLAPLVRAPGLHALAEAAYRLIARNRHRMPGGTAACKLPPR